VNRREQKAQAKRLARERKVLERDMARRHLAELRAGLKGARAHRSRRLAAVRAQCKADKAATRQRVKDFRAAELARIRNEIADARAGQVQACAIRREQAIQEAKGQKDEAARVLEAERAHRREMRRIIAWDRAEKKKGTKTAGKIARLQESDEAVERDIPPELVPLWRRVKGRIRGGERISRAEAFLHYAHENPDEVLAIVEADVDKTIAELEKKERDARRALKRAGKGPRKATPAELAGPWDEVG
jgi:hypothetical protein